MPGRQTGFPASIAEFLLVFRLRARRSSATSTDVMERAARIVLMTCQHWFTAAKRQKPGPRKRR